MFELQIMSDLHFDVNKKPFIPRVAAKNLALLGDIGRPTLPCYQAFIKWVSKLYETVFVIFGNHEYHGHRGDYALLDQWFENWLAKNGLKNVYFLQNKAVIIKNVKILGTTLWSSIKPEYHETIKRIIRDYRVTDATPESTTKLHFAAVSWLEQELSESSDQTCVVLTHHVPVDSVEAAGPYFGNVINSAFCTDLTYLMTGPVAVWCYGHVHYNNRFRVGQVRLYANHLGYSTENLDYDPTCVVEIEN